jgi:hypothetical protein
MDLASAAAATAQIVPRPNVFIFNPFRIDLARLRPMNQGNLRFYHAVHNV